MQKKTSIPIPVADPKRYSWDSGYRGTSCGLPIGHVASSDMERCSKCYLGHQHTIAEHYNRIVSWEAGHTTLGRRYWSLSRAEHEELRQWIRDWWKDNAPLDAGICPQ